jgi:hypothetical protein
VEPHYKGIEKEPRITSIESVVVHEYPSMPPGACYRRCRKTCGMLMFVTERYIGNVDYLSAAKISQVCFIRLPCAPPDFESEHESVTAVSTICQLHLIAHPSPLCLPTVGDFPRKNTVLLIPTPMLGFIAVLAVFFHCSESVYLRIVPCPSRCLVPVESQTPEVYKAEGVETYG